MVMINITFSLNGYKNKRGFESEECAIKVSTLSLAIKQGEEELNLPFSSIENIKIKKQELDLSKVDVLDASLNSIDFFESNNIPYS